MKKGFLAFVCIALMGAQNTTNLPIDLWNWKLELPTGYKASDWKLSNFQNDRFSRPFF